MADGLKTFCGSRSELLAEHKSLSGLTSGYSLPAPSTKGTNPGYESQHKREIPKINPFYCTGIEEPANKSTQPRDQCDNLGLDLTFFFAVVWLLNPVLQKFLASVLGWDQKKKLGGLKRN